ncbi:aldose 1-epimerase family protein [Lacisediminihabitans sp.]|uniref:aldose 1-epimerase family protein n=1 Tax=Lacisediminihabitans sp. TaxID=2787631 RepID=UPI00374DABF7
MGFLQLDNGILRVAINPLGAELSSLRHRGGGELLWQGGDPWHRRAPVLFPLVGRMPGDLLVHNGVAHPIGQHGFARDLPFEVGQNTATSAEFILVDTEETRRQFPFAFCLAVRFTVEGETLSIRHTVENPGGEAFSASIGGHPAFAWPLAEGIAPESHTLEFAEDEPAPIRRLAGGLLLPDAVESPVRGSTLALDESLFEADAIIFDALTSRSVRYSAPAAPSLTMRFDDFPLLGLWSKAPGAFLCIEPWYGMTAPRDFAGEYAQKPGQFTLLPGESRSFTYSVTVQDPQ